MAVKKGGLGKGLDSLIPLGAMEKENKTEETSHQIETLVKIGLVEPNREQPRKSFDESALEELADSIRQFGVLQPLLVQKKEDHYEIIAGERRWRAAKLAGLKEIPVLIREYNDLEVMEIALIENIQREDLNPIEEALAYKRLMEDFHLKHEDIAERVSKSRAAVTNAMRLLKLDPRVQDHLIDGMLSGGHARALLAIEETELQVKAAEQVIRDNLSVRETEKLVKDLLNPPKKPEKKERREDIFYEHLGNDLSECLETRVVIRKKDENRGKIEIEYFSMEELERITSVLKR
ncbi:MAG: ParB/RepB/Spo0J family partition protein [Lachnospiraceae bacterium]|nr:ParB/RepB/Spo0J family partition protein [Lachnospiraceae bacterium]